MKVSDSALEDVSKKINKNAAYRYENNPSLLELANEKRHILSQYGY